ncbi:MAG TPA: polysaccharide deacetylase family protein [Pyrinomonadaceae bacterium]|jgi:peptidoglycan/xylan/chitin deacetylase (PgdA/CDA1 family)
MNDWTLNTILIVIFSVLTALALGAWGIVYYLTYAVRSQILGKTVWRGSEDMNAVALTFDDGPSADTEKLLDVLRENNIKAVFFMVGKQVKKFPETARRIVAEGHEIGNHSHSHKILLFCSRRRIEYEIYKAQETITNTTGIAPRFIRPPCGVRTPTFFKTAWELKLQAIQWSVAGFDWKRRTAKQIADAVLRKTKAGSIILLHDGDSEGKSDRQATVEAIPLILKGLEARNLRILPLKQLIAKPDQKFTSLAQKKQSKRGESKYES